MEERAQDSGDVGTARDRALRRIATLRLEARIPPLLEALAGAGVPAIVLKGPSTRQRLYRPDEVRETGDIDLLVPSGRRRRADDVLRGLGFSNLGGVGHADTWRDGDGTCVDLHVTLPYAGREPRTVWRVLRAHEVGLEVGGRVVPVLDEAAHFVHLAIHAVQGGQGYAERPVDELRRALASFGPTVQADGRQLARVLDLEPVLDVALAHAAESLSPQELKRALPTRTFRPGQGRAFLGSSVSWQERARAMRVPMTRFWADWRVESWLAERGRPLPVEPWARRRVKVERLAWAARRELQAVRRHRGSSPSDPG